MNLRQPHQLNNNQATLLQRISIVEGLFFIQQFHTHYLITWMQSNDRIKIVS